MTPLHWAAFNNDKEVVGYLLNHGATMTYAFDGQCALDIAGLAKNDDVSIFLVLIISYT